MRQSALSREPVLPAQLLPWVRQETARVHDRVESRVAVAAVLATREAYGDWLDRLLGFQLPAEDRLADLLGPGHRVQSAALVAARAGLPGSLLERPLAAVVRPGSVSGALGLLYVTEGSALGRDQIARLAGQRLGLPVILAPRGATTGARWAEVRRTIAQRCTEPAELLAGANSAFVAMEEWLCT